MTGQDSVEAPKPPNAPVLKPGSPKSPDEKKKEPSPYHIVIPKKSTPGLVNPVGPKKPGSPIAPLSKGKGSLNPTAITKGNSTTNGTDDSTLLEPTEDDNYEEGTLEDECDCGGGRGGGPGPNTGSNRRGGSRSGSSLGSGSGGSWG